MIFDTHVHGIPCQCEVQFYSPYIPPRVYGTGRGDADPPYEPEFVFRLLDRKGYLAPWLERKLTEHDEQRLLREYLTLLHEEEYAANYEMAYSY